MSPSPFETLPRNLDMPYIPRSKGEENSFITKRKPSRQLAYLGAPYKKFIVLYKDSYKDSHDKRILQINIGRRQALIRELYLFYRKQNTLSVFDFRVTLSEIKQIQKELPKSHQKFIPSLDKKIKRELPEPHQKFIPSLDLIKLVEEHMVRPREEEVLELIEDIKKAMGKIEDPRENIKAIITEEVEDLITSIAKQIFTTRRPIKISEGNRFTSEICKDLINSLGLDLYDTRPVLDHIYNEFYNFVKIVPRERSWGKISIENSELKLILKDNAFTVLDPNEVEKDNKWTSN